MAERRRNKQKRRDDDEPEKPTKEETKVAKYMRFNCHSRDGKIAGMEVKCFIAGKMIDELMASKFANDLFQNRNACVGFLERLLQKNMFHRAFKVERKKDKDVKDGDGRKAIKDKESRKEKEKKKRKEGEDDKKKPKDEGDSSKEDGDKKALKRVDSKKDLEDGTEKKEKEEKKKKQKRLKLEMHDKQLFKDGDEVYVWIYDPTSLKSLLIGGLLVLAIVFGSVGVCLFPLWPPIVRDGVYYLSMAAAGFVGLIILLVIIRSILYCVVWAATFGRHHFWFLPNLTEDVGFFESFVPVYSHETSEQKLERERKEKKKRDKGKTKEVDKDKKSKTKEETAEEEAESPEVEQTGDSNPNVEGRESGSDVSEEERTENGFQVIEHEDLESKKDK